MRIAKLGLIGLGAWLLWSLTTLLALAQPVSPGVTLPTVGPVFTGTWTYRSYESDPNPAITPNDLAFGLAIIVLEEAADGTVNGTITGATWSLAIAGTVSYSATAVTAKFQGTGPNDGEDWVYDYFGFYSPIWDNGTDQVPAFVGTVVRTAPHGGQPAGFSGQFIAVKHPQD